MGGRSLWISGGVGEMVRPVFLGLFKKHMSRARVFLSFKKKCMPIGIGFTKRPFFWGMMGSFVFWRGFLGICSRCLVVCREVGAYYASWRCSNVLLKVWSLFCKKTSQCLRAGFLEGIF